MDRWDRILGNVCVERGWLDSERLSDCLVEAALAPGDPSGGSEGSELARVLVKRKIIPEDELETLRRELSAFQKKVAAAASDDGRLAQLLLDQGLLSKEELRTCQEPTAASEVAPPLAEVLLEKGLLGLGEIEEALRADQSPGTPLVCRSCGATSVIARFERDRFYLCKACTGELVPPGQLAAPAPAPPPTPEPAEVPKEIRYGSEKFDSLEEIGRGGMGIVYKAWDTVHKRWAAIKVIQASKKVEDLTRFRREVEIARALHHPNIVNLYEVTHDPGRHLVVMEYIDGRTLAGQRFPPEQAAQIMAVVARALQYAHSRGIIHRDLKPQNIMIDRGGKPYLMDFGLAKSDATRSSITSVGTAMGTPSYMAPEQAIGRSSRVDRRSDLYALGAILYDLTTGVPPFRGANPLDTLKKVVYEELVPPSKVVRGYPPALEAILLKALEKDRNRRYSSAWQLAEDLERFVAQRPA